MVQAVNEAGYNVVDECDSHRLWREKVKCSSKIKTRF